MHPSRTLAAAALALAAVTAAAAPPADWKPGDPIPSLARAYQGQLLVGAAVTPGMVAMGASHLFLERQFAVVTPEDAMKPLNLTRREGQYDFGMADLLVDWAVKSGIKIRGHCLVWHQQQAPWMFTRDGQPVSRDVLIERMRTYIHDVVGRYKGRIWAWDVVNEAFAVGEPKVETEDGWRMSEWYRIIGPDYIELAFRFAHEADPAALLVYNDYETQNPAKRALILALVRSLREKGLPVVVGHQAHLYQEHPAVAELEETIRALAAIGVKSQITELDVSLRPRWGAPVPAPTPELLAAHAQRYAELFRMFRRNRDALQAVVLWGVNDGSSWLRAGGGGADQPLLFDDWAPKPEFWAVLEEASK